MFNAQGDVVALVDGTGKVVVEYSYDAWGQPLTITGSMKDTLGKANPLRYRCYVYDEETGLYYLCLLYTSRACGDVRPRNRSVHRRVQRVTIWCLVEFPLLDDLIGTKRKEG